MRLRFAIEGNPIPWAAHKGYGKKAYNPRMKDRYRFQKQLTDQCKISPILSPIRLRFEFFMPIPKGTSIKNRALMLANIIKHTKRPDTTNMIKFTEDCLMGIILFDDSQNCEIVARKRYSDHPRTLIFITTLG